MAAMLSVSSILRRLRPKRADSANGQTPKKGAAAYKCSVNITPKADPLTKAKRILGGMQRPPKYARDKKFQTYLQETDVNDPALVLWLNEAKSRQLENGLSLKENLYSLWTERNAHFDSMVVRLAKALARPYMQGSITSEARSHLATLSLVVNVYFYLIIISEPGSRPELIKVGIVTNLALLCVYAFRFKIGRGPGASENPAVWIVKQLALPFGLGAFAGLFFVALIMNLAPDSYAHIINDGYGGMLNLMKIYWADLVAHSSR
jgi:hypothetical protein